ncbi:unnamed protein product [Litomosoides sigmodontis]|uniref:DUF7758 domain-containing protein n=1 Tax=Litomosoides sigmodontis TaxID=42156 RepID=A0A3P6VCC9_LITSI|nr:unnamed protein product [Litomosoides sigmodontis]
MDSTYRRSKIRTFRKKLTGGWKKARCTLYGLYLQRLHKYKVSVKRCLCSPLLCIAPEGKKICRLKIKPPSNSVQPVRQVLSKFGRKTTSELKRMKQKGDNWSTNDLFKFQHGNFDDYDVDEKRAICLEWLRRLSNITKKYCCLAWYGSAIYICYYRLAPLIIDKEEKKHTWIDVKREYAEIFLMGRRIWRRPTHPTRLRILYDLAMLCVLFNDIPNDETVTLFRDLLDDYDNFNFEVLDEIEYARSIDNAVRLENHVIDLFYQRRKSSCSTRSSFLSKGSADTPRSSFMRAKLSKASFLSIPDNMMSDSSVTVATSKNLPQVTHRQNVRFAGRSHVDAKAEAVTDKYLSPTSMMKLTGQNANSSTPRSDVISATEKLNVIASSILIRMNEVDVEIAVKKKSNDARTSGKLSFTLSDEIVASITVC